MTEYPYVRVDLQHRMLTVMLNDRKIHATDQLDDAHLVDLDAEGRAVGLDIMALDDLKLDEMGERFGFSDQVPTIRDAIQSVMAPTSSSFGVPMVVQGTSAPGLSAAAETVEPTAPPVVPTIVQ